MIQTREANTDDEAWLIEQLNQRGAELENFSPREFLLVVDDETNERLAFGRTEYVRNVDDTEFVIISNVVIRDRAEPEHGMILIDELAEKIQERDKNRVFTFPSEDHTIYRDVGFEQVDDTVLPEIMIERFEKNIERRGDSVIPLVADPSSVNFENEDDDNEGFNKPDNDVTEEDVEKIKEELDIDDVEDTKYSV